MTNKIKTNKNETELNETELNEVEINETELNETELYAEFSKRYEQNAEIYDQVFIHYETMMLNYEDDKNVLECLKLHYSCSHLDIVKLHTIYTKGFDFKEDIKDIKSCFIFNIHHTTNVLNIGYKGLLDDIETEEDFINAIEFFYESVAEKDKTFKDLDSAFEGMVELILNQYEVNYEVYMTFNIFPSNETHQLTRAVNNIFHEGMNESLIHLKINSESDNDTQYH